MKKSWGLVPKIISGEKTIESRWYINKSAPWGKIKKGDTVYFKNSGEPVMIKAEVKEVLSFENLNCLKVKEILRKYGKEDGICEKDKGKFYELFKSKKYCLLIFLKDPEEIKPFEISKEGFGMMSAWICAGNINHIKLKKMTR
jgi:ASC-1-like (ASCH) protein